MDSTTKPVFITSCPTRCFNTTPPAFSNHSVDRTMTSAQCDVLKLEHVIRLKISLCGYRIDSASIPTSYTEEAYSREPIDTIYVIWTRHDENHETQPP